MDKNKNHIYFGDTEERKDFINVQRSWFLIGTTQTGLATIANILMGHLYKLSKGQWRTIELLFERKYFNDRWRTYIKLIMQMFKCTFGFSPKNWVKHYGLEDTEKNLFILKQQCAAFSCFQGRHQPRGSIKMRLFFSLTLVWGDWGRGNCNPRDGKILALFGN